MFRCRAQSKEKTLCPNLQDVKNFIRIGTKLFFHEESLTKSDSGIKHVMSSLQTHVQVKAIL